MSAPRKPALVLIQGDHAARYVNGVQESIVEVDWEAGYEVHAVIEDYRANGLQE